MCWVSVTAWARRVRIKGFSPKRHAFIRSRDDKTKGRGMATDLDRRMDAGIAQLTSAEGTLPLTDLALDGRRLPMPATAPPPLPHDSAHSLDRTSGVSRKRWPRRCDHGGGGP